MSRKTKKPDSYADLIETAREKLGQLRKLHSLTIQDLEAPGLKRAEIHRILALRQERSREDWLVKLATLFRRVSEVVRNKGGTDRSWGDVFGEGFPVPPIWPNPAVSNYADLPLGRLRTLATPLVEYLDVEFRAAYDQTNVWKASQLLIWLCRLHELTGEWDRAASSFGQLAELNAKTGDFHHVADAHLRHGLALFYNGKPNEAEVLFQKGIDLLAENSSKIPPPRTQLRLLNYLALAKSEQGHADEARTILETRSLPLAQTRSSKAAVASVQNRLGVICLKLNDVGAAFGFLVKALGTRTSLCMRSEAARTLFTLGTVHEKRGELPQAIFAWQVSADLQKKLRDYEWLARTSYELGRAYVRMIDSLDDSRREKNAAVLDTTHFPDSGELAALKVLIGDIAPTTVAFQHRSLIPAARREFEAAIYWDTAEDGAHFADLARVEITQLETRPSKTPASQPRRGSSSARKRT